MKLLYLCSLLLLMTSCDTTPSNEPRTHYDNMTIEYYDTILTVYYPTFSTIEMAYGSTVPTGDDIINLVGKAVSPLTPNTEAPYYDGNNGSIAMLNADGFNMDAFGAISIQDNTKTAGTFMGWAKAYPDKISSGMFCGSTYAGVSYNTKDDPTSGVKNLQFFGFMPMTNKSSEADFTCNGTKVSYRIAGPVRCVRN